MYIAIDESGDLGKYPPSPSPYFVIAAIICDDQKQLDKVITRVRSKLARKTRKAQYELKHNNTTIPLRLKILNSINERNSKYAAVVIQKTIGRVNKVTVHQNYLEAMLHLLIAIISLYPQENTYIVHIDKGPASDMKETITNEIIRLVQKGKSGRTPEIIIKCINSENSESIQAADFIAGTIQNYYRSEKTDSQQWNIISENIVSLIEEKIHI